jgi:hypothetical protein
MRITVRNREGEKKGPNGPFFLVLDQILTQQNATVLYKKRCKHEAQNS